MADISKCEGKFKDEVCKKRDKCYRFTAESDEYWQTYMSFFNGNDVKCEWFINNKEYGQGRS